MWILPKDIPQECLFFFFFLDKNTLIYFSLFLDNPSTLDSSHFSKILLIFIPLSSLFFTTALNALPIMNQTRDLTVFIYDPNAVGMFVRVIFI